MARLVPCLTTLLWLACVARGALMTVSVAMPANDAEMMEAISGQNSVFVARAGGTFGQSGDVTTVKVDLSRLCDPRVPAECFSVDWTLFARLEPRANFSLPLQQRLLFKSRSGVLPAGATTDASPVWTQQFHPWELANVLDKDTQGLFYFHVRSPAGFTGAHAFAFDHEPFTLNLVLRRCHVLENHKEMQVALNDATDGSHHDAALAHYFIYDRVVPPPAQLDTKDSFFSARVMLRNELALILSVCRAEPTPHGVQVCLAEREFWQKLARQFSGKRFPLEFAAYLAEQKEIDNCRAPAELIGAINVGLLPIALATSACADSLCDNYCMRGVISALVKRAFAAKSPNPNQNINAKSLLVDVRIDVAHICASLINESELPECVFAIGTAIGELDVDREHAGGFCKALSHYEELLLPQACNEGYEFGLARTRIELQVRVNAKGLTTGAGIEVGPLCVVNALHAMAAFDCAKTVGKVLHDVLESAWAATQVCKTFIPAAYRIGKLVPNEAKVLVSTCEKGVAAAENAQETLNFDAMRVLHSLKNLTSDFYVVMFGQNIEPVFERIRVPWFEFLTAKPPASNPNAMVVFSAAKNIDNARLRELVQVVTPYYKPLYDAPDAVKQQRDLAGQPVRFFVVYEGHGALWHDALVEVNDGVPEFRLSGRVGAPAAPAATPTPPPTPAPTPTTTTKAPKTKAAKTTTSKAHKTKTLAPAAEVAESAETTEAARVDKADAPATAVVFSAGEASSSAGLVTPLVLGLLVLSLLFVGLRWRADQRTKEIALER